jgi:hypothetical protein
MEQLVILLLIALISFINWLVKKSAELREAKKRAAEEDKTGTAKVEQKLPSPPPMPPEAEPEISMRRLREALGLPKDLEPSPIPKRVAEVEKPVPPPLPPPRALPARPVIPHVPVTRAPVEPAHGEYRFIELPRGFMKPAERTIEAAARESRIRELLGSSGGLRDAVVLSEILGPPKSLRVEAQLFQ